jgi:hypothetical protein
MADYHAMEKSKGSTMDEEETFPSLEERLVGPKLQGEEEEELSSKFEELVKEVRWLGLFGVHTMKPPSAMLHCLAL